MTARLDDFLAMAYAAALGVSAGAVNPHHVEPASRPVVQGSSAPATTDSTADRPLQLDYERTVLTEARKAPLEWNMPANVREVRS